MSDESRKLEVTIVVTVQYDEVASVKLMKLAG
jgi:hypothetical protein